TYYLRRDGSPIDVSVSVAPLIKSEGEVVGMTAVIADITERKRAQEERTQLFEQERAARRAAEAALRSRDEFLSIASHELRTPVTRLEGELRAAGCSITFDVEPAIGRWDAARLDQVVTNLLTNAMKFGAGKPIEVWVRSAGDRATLSVVDNGIGIAPDAHGRIF